MAQPSTIDLATVKRALRVTHSYDDQDLQRRITSAEQECLRFLNRDQLPTLPYELPGADTDCLTDNPSEEIPSSEDPVAPDIVEGVILMVQAGYEGDPTTRGDYRKGAESLWWPYRTALGV